MRKTKNTFLLVFICSLSSDDEESASVCWVFHLQLLAFPVCKFPCTKFGKMKGKEKKMKLPHFHSMSYKSPVVLASPLSTFWKIHIINLFTMLGDWCHTYRKKFNKLRIFYLSRSEIFGKGTPYNLIQMLKWWLLFEDK